MQIFDRSNNPIQSNMDLYFGQNEVHTISHNFDSIILHSNDSRINNSEYRKGFERILEIILEKNLCISKIYLCSKGNDFTTNEEYEIDINEIPPLSIFESPREYRLAFNRVFRKKFGDGTDQRRFHFHLSQQTNNIEYTEIDEERYQNPIIEYKQKNINYLQRSRIYKDEALEQANYQCEFNNSHTTFLVNNKQYMEGHHLIPISNQNKFDKNLDTPINIISLCPNCHKMAHYGDSNIIKDIINKKCLAKIIKLTKFLKISKEEVIKLATNT